MIKKIFFKKVKPSDEDKHLLNILRLNVEVNEHQFKLNIITEDEYKEALKEVVSKVEMLEGKYGLYNN